jgi:Predicted transcriptional regulator
VSFSDRLAKALHSIDIQRHGAGAWLAKKTGTTVKAANKWLNGESHPRREKVETIAALTKVRTEWLEYGTGLMRETKSHMQLNEPLADYTVSSIAQPSRAHHSTQSIELPYLKESELTTTQRPTSSEAMIFNASLLEHAGIEPANALAFSLSGDSMAPVLPNNALVAVDTEDTSITDGKIYAFVHGELLRVRYLYRLPYGALSVRSSNPAIEDEALTKDQVDNIRIIGRVFWYSAVI